MNNIYKITFKIMLFTGISLTPQTHVRSRLAIFHCCRIKHSQDSDEVTSAYYKPWLLEMSVYLYLTDYVEYDGVCMMFCDVVQFTQQNNMEKALKDLNQAYRWLVRLCQVFNLDIVSMISRTHPRRHVLTTSNRTRICHAILTLKLLCPITVLDLLVAAMSPNILGAYI